MSHAICKVMECKGQVRTRGYCQMHYLRVWKYGDHRVNKRITHNMTHTKEYKIWHSMNMRCHSKSGLKDPNYGGRGITVCNRWRDSFENFLEDMGRVPNYDYSLDRINVNGNYSPGNCRWATRDEQENNKRTTNKVTINGVTKSLSQWARESGIKTETVRTRFYRGWPLEKALK